MSRTIRRARPRLAGVGPAARFVDRLEAGVADRLAAGDAARLAAGLAARRVAPLAVGLAAGLFAVAACAPSEPAALPSPIESIGPAMTVSPAVGQVRAEIVRVLGTENLVLTDTQSPVRPAESALLVDAPRAVFQVTLPADPTRGFIVVYEFSDSSRAADAAAEEQRYLATGPGRVQTPEGTVYVLRQVGSTVVLYDWLPGVAKDPSAPKVQAALETLGVGFPIDR